MPEWYRTRAADATPRAARQLVLLARLPLTTAGRSGFLRAPAMEVSRRRFTLIDGLRGLAAVSVMLYHYCTGDMRVHLAALLPAWFMAATRKGWLGVQVFFVLSGFVIAYAIGRREMTAGNGARFALRRQVRLDPPYWLSLALSCAWPWGWKLHLRDARWVPGWADVGYHLAYLQDIFRRHPIQPVYWTLAIEVQFYMAFVLSLVLLRRWPRLAPWVLLASGLWALDVAMHWRIPKIWFVPHWYMFVLGVLTWWRLDKRVHWLPHALFIAWIALNGYHYDRLEPWAAASVATLITLAGARDRLHRWLDVRWLQFLGAVSYGIYLLHPVTGSQTRWVLGSVLDRGRTPTGALGVVIASSVATVGCAWLLHVAVEKPAMALAARIRWDKG
jgi:peptidoglycan/LPS O-acetylase OafA/YrhL